MDVVGDTWQVEQEVFEGSADAEADEFALTINPLARILGPLQNILVALNTTVRTPRASST